MVKQRLQEYNFSGDRKLMWILSSVFVLIVAITIFQDFLESGRRGYPFYFNESLLFKTVWFLFIPILTLLYQYLKKRETYSISQMGLSVGVSIAAHLVSILIVVWLFSAVFFGGRYGFEKTFGYTLANDLYKLVSVYGTFVFVYSYISASYLKTNQSTTQVYPLQHIVVSNGNLHTIVNASDIALITAATPYIALHIGDKKHLHAETLKSIGNKLDGRKFVRVHKSIIVNIDHLVSYKSRLNGDYDLILQNDETVRLSRTYVADFKRLFSLSTTGMDSAEFDG